jgi:hypothetical protein
VVKRCGRRSRRREELVMKFLKSKEVFLWIHLDPNSLSLWFELYKIKMQSDMKQMTNNWFSRRQK